MQMLSGIQETRKDHLEDLYDDIERKTKLTNNLNQHGEEQEWNGSILCVSNEENIGQPG